MAESALKSVLVLPFVVDIDKTRASNRDRIVEAVHWASCKRLLMGNHAREDNLGLESVTICNQRVIWAQFSQK